MRPPLNHFESSSVTRRTRASSILLASLGVVLAAAGCKTQTPEVAAPPASDETLAVVRQSLTSADPKAVVGRVIAVLPDQMYAAVSDISLKDFSEGEPITFIDSNKKFLTNGIIKKITADALNVQYEKPAPDQRAPRVGDLAVRFKE